MKSTQTAATEQGISRFVTSLRTDASRQGKTNTNDITYYAARTSLCIKGTVMCRSVGSQTRLEGCELSSA